MAPEVVTGYNATEFINAKKVDVYAAGILFGYLWTGIEPYKNLSKKIDIPLLYECKKRGEKPNLIGGKFQIPLKLKKLIEKMLSRVPVDRPNFNEIANIIKEFI